MKRFLHGKAIDKNSIHVGLIGSGIQASRSPAMHMSESRAQGINLDYELFDLDVLGISVDALPQLLDEIEDAGYTGLNITHPCKQQVINHLDRLSNDAKELGAVNTVIFHEDGRTGYNTDWVGFYNSFNQGLPDVAINRVLQLGAGGAGSAVAYALGKIGVKELNIFDIDKARATQLAQRLSVIFVNTQISVLNDPEDIPDMDGIINTTPMGMKNHPGTPLQASQLAPGQWFAEVIYFPLETELLRTARTLGCNTLDGSGMAIHQAAEAFRLFTGHTANIHRLKQAFLTACPV